MDCLFCKIIKREIPADIVYEDDDFLAFLDITPINPGHTLLIPKKHFTDIFDTPKEILEKRGPLTKKIANAVKIATRADGINIMMNNGGVAGQVIFHTHLHIIPRFSDDGHHIWHGKKYPKDTAQKISSEIKKLLN